MSSFVSEFNRTVQSIQRQAGQKAQHLERLTAQLQFARRLCAVHPEQADEWQALLLDAAHMLDHGLAQSDTDFDLLTAHLESKLAPVGQAAKAYTLLCISHAHIDMNWMWSWPETVAVTNDTFGTMLTLMDEFPAFIFSQDQVSVYDLIERYHPQMFEKIQQRVREGRWEITASQWVEGDKNMASGESLCRHLLYARRYVQEKFGLGPEAVQVDFEPDTFGHAATIPTILARGGVKYYYHCRGSVGPHLYWWLGPDGARVLAFSDVQWYMSTISPEVADALPEYAQATGMKAMPVLYGVGDHGGGPTRRDLKRIIEMNEWPVFPKLEFSTLHHFFHRAEAEATGVPEISGERNFVFTGCYTSQARQKQANRHGENLLYTAEAAAVLGERLGGVPYPQENLRQAWIKVLFSQFHDILPGSGVRETRHYTLGQAQETQAAASMARTNALRALSLRVNTGVLRSGADAARDEAEGALSTGAGVGHSAGMGGESTLSVSSTAERAFLVFNPLPFARSEVIEVKLWDCELDKTRLVANGEGIDPCPVQVLDEGRYWGHRYLTVAFPVDVPALGYRTLCLSDRLDELRPAQPLLQDPWAGMMGSWRQIQPDDWTLENEHLRVEIDPPSGGLTSLLDKRSGREWAAQFEPTGVLQVAVERNQGMSAWVIGQFTSQQDLLDGGALTRVHSGPYVNTWRWTRKVDASTLELDLTLKAGSPRLDYRLRVDWREMGSADGIPNLRVRFALNVEHPQLRYEIPFGAIRRDLTAGQEVPALRWADVAKPGRGGVALLNSSKYGHSFDQDTLSLTLLRASTEPDPLPDLGEHVIEYALLPHADDWTAGEASRAGAAFNTPLVALSCLFQAGDLPTWASFVEIAQPNVQLAAFKQSEDGAGLILRLVEMDGQDTTAQVALSPLLGEMSEAVEVDTMERGGGEKKIELNDNALIVDLPALGISTIRIG